MRILTVFITTVVISGWISNSQSNALSVLKIFKTGIDIFKTGFQIVNLIRNRNSGSIEDLQAQLEEVRRGIERMIKSSTTDIIREITLQNKLNRIESIVKEMQSLVIDMKDYVLADNEIDRESYRILFLERFDQRVVAMIRELPGLLTYTIPGLSVPLVDLILDTSKCNMSAIHNFQLFYADLLSAGSTLQFVFRELSNITSEDVEHFWNESLPGIQEQFDNMEKTCKERLPEYAAEEIKQNIEADVMYTNCKERYTWAWSDILYYPPMGTYQLHYHTSVAGSMFWNGASSSGRNQIMVIGNNDGTNKTWDPKAINSALASNNDTFYSVIDGSEDSSAAMKIGKAVEEFLKRKGFLLKAIIVFFDAEALGNVTYKLDKDSPGAHVSIEGVTLTYCYNTGVVCTITRWDFLNFNDEWREYTGTFNVYVYPCSTSDQSTSSEQDCVKHSTSAAMRVTKSVWTTGVIGLFVVVFIFLVKCQTDI